MLSLLNITHYQLFIRENRRITLIEEDMILRKRAEEIVELVWKTKNEITASDDMLTGDIEIGAGKTDKNQFLIKAMMNIIWKKYQILSKPT